MFFYLKRRNLSLDNRKRITTIYVTVWKLFTYTRLEIVINFSQMPIWWICEYFIFWTEYSTDFNLFFYLKRRNLSLDNRKKNYYDICYCLKIIYIYATWNRNSYKFFPNADLMDMRKFYILNGMLDRFLICFLSKKAKPILRQSKKNYYDICYCLKIIYIYATWNSYKFFPNADLMDMRKFYIWTEYSTDS